MLRVGVGPGPVEHVFPIRVRLRVQRHGRRKALATLGAWRPQRQVARAPAGLVAGAAAGMHGMQEGVAQERRGPGLGRHQGVPFGFGQLGQIENDLRAIILHPLVFLSALCRSRPWGGRIRLVGAGLERFRLHCARFAHHWRCSWAGPCSGVADTADTTDRPAPAAGGWGDG